MKKTVIYFLAVLIAFSSCVKDSTTEPSTPSDNTGNSGGSSSSLFKWEYEIVDLGGSIFNEVPLMLVDENDNVYVLNSNENQELFLVSLNKDGQKNWEVKVSDIYNTHKIMGTNDKIIVAYSWDKLAAFSKADGTKLWEISMQNGFYDMAFSNGTIYVSENNTYNDYTTLTAISESTGNINWQKIFNKITYPKLSANNNLLSISYRNEHNYPYEYGLMVLKDNNSSFDSLWSVAGKPHRAIFDGQGNIYFEDDGSGSTIVRSYNAETGVENWNTQIKDITLANVVSMIYTSGKVVATYRSDDSWAIENSFAILNASDGSIIAQKENSIHDEYLLLLTGDDKILTFYQDEAGIHKILYNLDGSVANTEKPDYAQGIILSAYHDLKINSQGNLYILSSDYLYCAEHDLSPSPSGAWVSIHGNYNNTNNLQ